MPNFHKQVKGGADGEVEADGNVNQKLRRRTIYSPPPVALLSLYADQNKTLSSDSFNLDKG